MSNRIVKLPPVESFGHLTPDKWLLLKTLEEAAEMVEAGKRLVKGDSKARRDLIAEWADVLQTLANVATAFDITDEELAQAMDDCLVHNQDRDRQSSAWLFQLGDVSPRPGRLPPGAQDRWPICKRLSERGRGETNHAGTATGNQGGGR